MGAVSEILNKKPTGQLHTARPDETVLQATKRMNDVGVGSLLVMEGPQLTGIITERDILRRVVAAERQPAAVRVDEVMTRNITCVNLESSLDDARNIMRQVRVRHLPVVTADGEVRGMISIGDLNAYFATNQEVEIHYLQEYLHGRT
jgi:CBS domain-containing protein